MEKNGLIWAANGHSCPKYIQPYKARADIITGDNFVAMIGVDELVNISALEESDAHLALKNAQAAIDYTVKANQSIITDAEMGTD